MTTEKTICDCPKTKGAGIGICKDCGLPSCSFFGCFVAEHENHQHLMRI